MTNSVQSSLTRKLSTKAKHFLCKISVSRSTSDDDSSFLKYYAVWICNQLSKSGRSLIPPYSDKAVPNPEGSKFPKRLSLFTNRQYFMFWKTWIFREFYCLRDCLTCSIIRLHQSLVIYIKQKLLAVTRSMEIKYKYYWRIKDQLDVTCYFISLLMCSTCFGH